jgi:coatomer protein complex subunit gamma
VQNDQLEEENKQSVHLSFIFYCFQFDCLNTLNDQLLENVRVQVEPPDGYQLVREVPCPRLAYSETGTVYVVLQFPEELGATIGE